MHQMKNSGIEWVGDIPDNWDRTRIKYIFKCISGNGFNLDLQGQDSGDLPFCKASDISSADKLLIDAQNYVSKQVAHLYHYNIIPKNSIIFAKIGEAMKKNNRAICALDCCVDNNCQALVPLNNINCIYAYYILKCIDMKWYDNAGTIPCVNNRKLLNSSMLIPPIDEQERIAGFLDKKCGEIDGLIADIKTQVQTLEQYKRSVITEAITKGLNPFAEMNDSGIQWLGVQHVKWRHIKGKYLFKQRNDRGNNIELQLLSPTQNYGVIPQSKYEELSGMSAVKLNDRINLQVLKTIHIGDFCISLRSFQGGFEYSNYEGVVSPAYQVFYATIPICDGYYRYLFKESSFIGVINSYTISLRDGKNIAFSDFGNTYLPYPPLSEQKEIADYLDNKCAQIEELISAKQSQIETLESYKKSLIYEYVTGKKEVV